jgi:hypothetical protein
MFVAGELRSLMPDLMASAPGPGGPQKNEHPCGTKDFLVQPPRDDYRKANTMIIHASVPADDTARVASVLGELWRCEHFPFLFPGHYLVVAGDERGTQIEVGPRGNSIVPAETMMSFQPNPSPSPYSEVHLNIETPLTVDEVLTIAKREGWTARVCDRGGAFKVIEFFLENRFMLELMTDHELQRYRSFMSPENLRMIAKKLPPTSKAQ